MEKNIKNIAKGLTDELLFAFTSITTRENLKKIATRYDFLEELNSFLSIVEKTLYGEIKIQELEKNLTQSLGVSKEVAEYIGIELDQDLFSSVRDEFNVAQGIISMEEYLSKHSTRAHIQQIEEEDEIEETLLVELSDRKDQLSNTADSDTPKPTTATTETKEGTEVARRDPYREPID